MEPNLKELANFIESLSKQELFSCLALSSAHQSELSKNFTSVNSFLKSLATLVRSTGNLVAKKDKIISMIAEDGMYAKTIINTRNLFEYRNLWLPMQHAEKYNKICNDDPRTKGAVRRFMTIQDYATNYLKLDYQALSEEQKKLTAFGYFRAVTEDSLSANGIDKLAMEDQRFYAALNLIPPNILNEYQNQITITSNPFDFIVEVLKLYATGYTITPSSQYEVLDI